MNSDAPSVILRDRQAARPAATTPDQGERLTPHGRVCHRARRRVAPLGHHRLEQRFGAVGRSSERHHSGLADGEFQSQGVPRRPRWNPRDGAWIRGISKAGSNVGEADHHVGGGQWRDRRAEKGSKNVPEAKL
ncbi:hypothetical protein [Neorhodopirellula pilleata]|uniref:hypothetical protein n=1 Tax=Neorhodopirellula pilleata TaxID=2714738 RepID=UPI0018CE8D41|nr:hypothetical protein [Neorhodopirellula pilleata]